MQHPHGKTMTKEIEVEKPPIANKCSMCTVTLCICKKVDKFFDKAKGTPRT